MRMVPESEDDTLAKTALFTKYVEMLPAALEEWQSCGLDMVFDLLAGIQEVVKVNRHPHQNLFRCRACSLHFFNFFVHSPFPFQTFGQSFS